MKQDTKGKETSAMHLTGEIVAKEYREAIDDVSMSKSGQRFPQWQKMTEFQGGTYMDVSLCH